MGFLTDLIRGQTDEEVANTRKLMGGMLIPLATEVAAAEARIQEGRPNPSDRETIDILGPRLQGIASELGLEDFSSKALVQGFRARPQPQVVPSGAAFGTTEPTTGKFLPQGRVQPALPASTRARGRKLSNVLSRHNITQQWAEDVLDGFVDTGKDELGNNVLINKVTRRQIPVNPGQAKAVESVLREQRPEPTIIAEPAEELARGGTGPASNLMDLVTKAGGLIPYLEKIPFAENRRKRQALALVANTTQRALIKNQKFPLGEQKVVAELVPDPDRFFENPDAAAQDITVLRAHLKRENAIEEASLEQPMAPKFRQDAQERIRVRRMIIELLGTPTGFDVPLTPEDIDNMSPEEVRETWRKRRAREQ